MSLSDMSFEEKSTWVSLAAILFVYASYFSQVFEGLVNNNLNKGEVAGLFIGAVVILVIIQVVLQIILAASNSKDADRPNDERDRLFALRAGYASDWILSFGILTIAVAIFLKDLDSLWAANLLFLLFVISQVVSYALTLFFYRRGY